ncbi:hypothetical protein BKA70DRAFT_1163295 [Coprinopsis sp. MPI-PUGE-AT-0042]|nr:hypothetical protein BKA70DRAFT_1163295 [Coprinopsis sp. MPI-PUGE-AT-0042]
MQFTTFFAVLATAITMVQAGCYSGGETWSPDQVQANNELNGLCNNLAGGFTGGQEKYACRNAGTPNKKLEFRVTNTAGNSLSLNHGDCVLRLGNEINGCSHGGDTTTAGWRFRADPNSGRC